MLAVLVKRGEVLKRAMQVVLLCVAAGSPRASRARPVLLVLVLPVLACRLHFWMLACPLMLTSRLLPVTGPAFRGCGLVSHMCLVS